MLAKIAKTKSPQPMFGITYAPYSSEYDALQMESLKRDMLAKIAETKAACEANIEAKAVELAEELESADRCPCAPAHPAW